MRKLIQTTFLLLFSFSSLYAQIEKSDFIVGGTAKLNADIFSISGDDFRLGLYPQLGVFLKDNFALGGKLHLTYKFTSETRGTEKDNEFYYGIIPFVRYYFNQKNNRRLFVEADLGLLGEITETAESWQYDFLPYGAAGFGISYRISNCIGLEPILVLNSLYGLAINAGFQIYL